MTDSQKLSNLRAKNKALSNEAEKILNRYADDDTLSQTDEVTFNRLLEELDMATAEIDKTLDDIAVRNAIRPLVGNPQDTGIADAYHKNFLSAIRSGFRRHEVLDILREGQLDSGGYLLPTEFDDRIVTKLQSANALRQICRVIQTASTHKIPLVATQPAASWLGEGSQIQFSDTTFGEVSLGACKLAVGTKISNELLQDSFYDLENFLTEEFGRSLARAEEEAFLNGTGTNNQPKGILPSMAESVSSTLQTSSSAISADDLTTLIYSVDREYRSEGKFLMSDTTLAQIRKLKDSTQNYLWTQNLTSAEPPQLLGYPVFSSSCMPAPTAGNVAVLFGDFQSGVTIGDRGQRIFKPLRELYAVSDESAFLLIERTDIALVDRNAIRGLKIRE